MDEGSGEDLTLPRREFVMPKSCLDVLLAKIGRTKHLFVNEQSRLDPLSFSSTSFTLRLKKLGSHEENQGEGGRLETL